MANNNMLRANQAARANNNRPMISPAVYGECIRNRLTGAMTYDTDGCLAFAPGGPPGSTQALRCQTCGCSRNFHRRLDTNNLPPPAASHQIYDDTRLVYSPPVFTAPSSTIIPPPSPPPQRTQPDAPAADVNVESSNANANSLAESFRVTAVESISTGSVNLQCVHSPVSATRGSVKGKEVMDAEIAKTFAALPPLPPRQHRSKSPAVSGKKKSTITSSDVVSEIMKDKVWLLTEELEWLNMKNKEEEDKKNNEQLEETNSNVSGRNPIFDHTIERSMNNRAEVLKTMNHQFLVIATTLTARRELGDQSPCSAGTSNTESENDKSSSDSDSDSDS